MTIKDEIIAIANQIANTGKKPSVALVKTRLSQAVPLPTIISTLKSWQHEPENTSIEKASNSEIQTSIENSEQHLTKADLQPVLQELSEVKLLLNDVLKRLDE